jgi:hypothetical protein
MTAARLKRLARLESRKPVAVLRVDPVEVAALLRWCLASFAAVEAGKACAVPRYGPPESPSPALEAIMRESDRMHARLMAERHP